MDRKDIERLAKLETAFNESVKNINQRFDVTTSYIRSVEGKVDNVNDKLDKALKCKADKTELKELKLEIDNKSKFNIAQWIYVFGTVAAIVAGIIW